MPKIKMFTVTLVLLTALLPVVHSKREWIDCKQCFGHGVRKNVNPACRFGCGKYIPMSTPSNRRSSTTPNPTQSFTKQPKNPFGNQTKNKVPIFVPDVVTSPTSSSSKKTLPDRKLLNNLIRTYRRRVEHGEDRKINVAAVLLYVSAGVLVASLLVLIYQTKKRMRRISFSEEDYMYG